MDNEGIKYYRQEYVLRVYEYISISCPMPHEPTEKQEYFLGARVELSQEACNMFRDFLNQTGLPTFTSTGHYPFYLADRHRPRRQAAYVKSFSC